MHLDILATHEHYRDHVAPIAEELQRRGVKVRILDELQRERHITLVSSYGDLTSAIRAGRRTIYMEHGAGQAYSNNHGSYAGSSHRKGVIAFLNPGPHVSKANKRAHPRVRSYDIGVPKMDRWHGVDRVPNDRPVVCISFHWDCRISPEARTAFPYFQSALEELAKCEEFELIGHCHPRAKEMVLPTYEGCGIRFIETFDEVLDLADVYVCDNSSTIYEFASTDRPVVLLNAPWYRRDAQHGLRFWREAKVGVQCDSPEDLHASILEAIEDTDSQKRARRASIARVYSYTDGHATQRAVDAIEEVIMAQEDAKKEAYILEALRTLSGNYGLVCPGHEVHIYPDRSIASFDKHGRPGRLNVTSKMAPTNIERYVQELTRDRGNKTQFKLLKVPDSLKTEEGQDLDETEKASAEFNLKSAPKPEGNKQAPPAQEDKRAPEPQEDKQSDPIEESIASQLLAMVAGGSGKSKAIKMLGTQDEYTYREVEAVWDELVEAGEIVAGEGRGEWLVK